MLQLNDHGMKKLYSSVMLFSVIGPDVSNSKANRNCNTSKNGAYPLMRRHLSLQIFLQSSYIAILQLPDNCFSAESRSANDKYFIYLEKSIDFS